MAKGPHHCRPPAPARSMAGSCGAANNNTFSPGWSPRDLYAFPARDGRCRQGFPQSQSKGLGWLPAPIPCLSGGCQTATSCPSPSALWPAPCAEVATGMPCSRIPSSWCPPPWPQPQNRTFSGCVSVGSSFFPSWMQAEPLGSHQTIAKPGCAHCFHALAPATLPRARVSATWSRQIPHVPPVIPSRV